jgi:hypothetical protein
MMSSNCWRNCRAICPVDRTKYGCQAPFCGYTQFNIAQRVPNDSPSVGLFVVFA